MKLLHQTSLAAKRNLIEKTPDHIKFTSVIRANIDQPRFIIPVRDGRDVVASLVRRGIRLENAVNDWIYKNTLALAEAEKEDVLVYRHEDLVRDSETTIRKICAFLDLEYDDQLLDYSSRKRNWFHEKKVRRSEVPPKDGKEHHALRNWQVNQPIFDSSGRWKNELREDDLSKLASGHGRYLMEAFGYF